MKQIPFNNLKHEYAKYQNEYDRSIKETLLRGNYILGSEVTKFEKDFAKYIGTEFCIGVNSGLDALIIGLRALEIGQGDEVIVPANTYIASIIAISEVGAQPILVEPDEYYNIDPKLISEAINENTKAVLVVHLYGQSARMREIDTICKYHSLLLIEDCAQSHGSKFENVTSGNWGDVSCFSFYPTKNLGAFGDGGACLTSNPETADKIRLLRNYGSKIKYHNEIIGVNSRLDEIQAAILNVKLNHFEFILKSRKKTANFYLNNINNPKIILPSVHRNSSHVWHLFVVKVEDRDRFQEYLKTNGVETIIHYPIPPHLSRAYEGYFHKSYPRTEKLSKTVISIPLYDWMKKSDAERVVNLINRFE